MINKEFNKVKRAFERIFKKEAFQNSVEFNAFLAGYIYKKGQKAPRGNRK